MAQKRRIKQADPISSLFCVYVYVCAFVCALLCVLSTQPGDRLDDRLDHFNTRYALHPDPMLTFIVPKV